MTKNRLSVLALLAMVLAMSSAFTSKMTAETAAKRDPSFYWFTGAGATYHTQNTTAAESSLTGCQYSLAVCEQAYTSAQLNNPAQPSMGVKSSQVNSPQAIIRKNTN